MSKTQTVLITPSFTNRKINCSTTQGSTVGELRNRINEQYYGIVDKKDNIIFEDDDRKCLLDDNSLLKNNQKINLYLHNYPTYTSVITKKLSKYLSIKNKDNQNIDKKSPFIINLLFILAGAIFISVFAQLSFYFPWNKDVPVSFQTFAVLFNSAIQGPWNSSISCIIYILLGLIKLPVYTNFASGYEAFTGLTFGYFIGFIFASLIVGYLSKKGWDKQYRKIWLSMLIGNIVIYLFGLTWFIYRTKDVWFSIKTSVLPFIPGDLLKIGLASLFIPIGWKIFYFRNQSIEMDIENHL